MTKFQATLQDVNIVNVKEATSKRGNKYFVLNCIYDGELIAFYCQNLNATDCLGVHKLRVEITISKYASVRVIEVM